MMADSEKAIQRDEELNVEDCSDKGEKMNSGLCMSAGIETATDSDQSRFQRRHFPNRMTSDIFCFDLPKENIVSKNKKSQENKFPAAGTDTRHDDLKQLERRHFYLPSEDNIQPENYPDKDDKTDSLETDDMEEKETERRHFHGTTDSNIFFCP